MCETNTSMQTRSPEVSPSLTSAAAQCGPGGNLGARVVLGRKTHMRH